jgi:hypothetical protein
MCSGPRIYRHFLQLSQQLFLQFVKYFFDCFLDIREIERVVDEQEGQGLAQVVGKKGGGVAVENEEKVIREKRSKGVRELQIAELKNIVDGYYLKGVFY